MSAHTLPSAEICDRARASRDARFDGLFFTAVRSTGIYCRPMCPAPAPKRSNIEYFANASAARAAGYRPCLRCRPELSPEAWGADRDDAVQRALALIGTGELEAPSVDALARAVGLSARHLRRRFSAVAGATPIAVHSTRRLLQAKQLLTETTLPITEVALASGFNSLRRFNAAFLEGNGMPPSAIRRMSGAMPASGGLTLRLAYRPPFDFAHVLSFLASRALPGIEHVDATAYERVFGPPDAPTAVRVSAAQNRPELLLEISAGDPRGIPGIVARVRRMFDLEADLVAVHGVLTQDPLLRASIIEKPGLRMPGGWDGFETMVRAVLGQQVTVKGASTLAARLVARFGTTRAPDSLTVLGSDFAHPLDRMFPLPETLADAPLESIGLPRTRAATLRGLAIAVHEGRVHFGAAQRLDEFVARCTALPGIGTWTAHYVALRALGHPDAFPAGDLVLRRVLGGLQTLRERDAESRAQTWRPWRAYALLHLWNMAAPTVRTQEKK